jgi:probable HAF family extracellular repeat protein
MTSLGGQAPIAATYPTAVGISGNSQAVFGGASQIFVYSNGTVSALGIDGTAYAINNSGQVVGNLGPSNVASLYSNGTVQLLGLSAGAAAYGINDTGQITGETSFTNNSNGYPSAFLYGNGPTTNIGNLCCNAPGSTGGSNGYAINASGQVTGVGIYSNWPTGTPAGSAFAFLYSNGAMTNLGTLGGMASFGQGISNNGLVTGSSLTAGNAAWHAYLYSRGAMRDLGTLAGDDASYGQGVNDSGDVVGVSVTGNSSVFRAFLYTNGQMLDLNTLVTSSPLAKDVTLFEAYAINNSGAIVAGGYNPTAGTDAYYLLTPTSAIADNSPSSDGPIPIWALCALGASLFGIASRRLKKAA